MSFLQKICGREKLASNWEQIKNTGLTYPKHSFSILKLTLPNGHIGTGWVDKGYKKYNYKEFCPYIIEIEIDLTDAIAVNNPELDMGDVEDFFSNKMKRTCICHIVSRIVSEKGMRIIAYTDQEEQIGILLKSMMSDKKRLVTFQFKITYDPKWKKADVLF